MEASERSNANRTKQSLITSFVTATVPQPARPAIDQRRPAVISLFDNEGTALDAWKSRGYKCISYQHSDDAHRHQNRDGSNVIVCNLHDPHTLANIAAQHNGTVAFACAMPPSKDLSVAGARHWKRKRDKDPEFQQKAARLVALIETTFLQWECPYYIANPATSMLRKLLRAPNYTYQPYEFGGHLAPSDKHPLYPEHIPEQDAYTQAQGLWTGGGFRMPVRKPVVPQWKYFVSKRKGASTGMRRMSPILYGNWNARGARACTPRGFARALCERLHAPA